LKSSRDQLQEYAIKNVFIKKNCYELIDMNFNLTFMMQLKLLTSN